MGAYAIHTNLATVDTDNFDNLQQTWPTHHQAAGEFTETSDHFVKRGDLEFAGTHLLIDLMGAHRLDELDYMEEKLRRCVDVSGATLLHIHLHHFTPNGGISGVAVLAESHISVHTWPERNYAAFDVFMCGDAKPEETIPVLEEAFSPQNVEVTEHLRGMVTGND